MKAKVLSDLLAAVDPDTEVVIMDQYGDRKKVYSIEYEDLNEHTSVVLAGIINPR
jgi:hypothetical protein